MNSWDRRIAPSVLQGADLALMAVAFAGASALVTHQASLDALLSVRVRLSDLLLFLVFAVTWHLVFAAFGLYRRRSGRHAGEPRAIVLAVALGTAFLVMGGVVLDLPIVDLQFLGIFGVAAATGTQGLRYVAHRWSSRTRRRGCTLRRVVIVGCGSRGAALGRAIWRQPALGYMVEGYIDDMPPPPNPLHGRPERHLGTLADVDRLLRDGAVDEVFVTLPVKSFYETIAGIVALGEQSGFIVRIPADMFELRVARSHVDDLDGVHVLTLETPRPGYAHLAAKRLIDLCGASLALVPLAPLFVVLFAMIKLDSPGPALFVQDRIGLAGRRFRLFKFRTMVADAADRLDALEAHNEVDGAAFKMVHDPRVTRVGRFLRRFSLDELPQFVNVLIGEMSLVGPRPLPVRDVKRFDQRWLHRRFTVKPGLTCLWQINGRHAIGFQQWMELDLQYVDHWSLKLDWQILARTMPAVMRGVGAS